MRKVLLGGLIVVALVAGAALAVMTFLPPSATRLAEGAILN